MSVPEGGIAVVEYQDGCRDTEEGGKDYSVSYAYCICKENLDASKHSRHDTIAELSDINGEALVNNTLGTEGMELKENDLVTVGDVVPEEDSAMVEYYFGCDYKVKENETYTVNAEECCKALLLPPPMIAPPVSPSIGGGGGVRQLVSGAVGGNIAGGRLFKNLSLGALGNSIAGIIGGGLGGQILGMLGVGAGVLLAVVGLVKKLVSK